MNRRIICPYCHSPVDPYRMEEGACGSAQYRICPECDEPVVFASLSASAITDAPTPAAASVPLPIEQPSPIFCIVHGNV